LFHLAEEKKTVARTVKEAATGAVADVQKEVKELKDQLAAAKSTAKQELEQQKSEAEKQLASLKALQSNLVKNQEVEIQKAWNAGEDAAKAKYDHEVDQLQSSFKMTLDQVSVARDKILERAERLQGILNKPVNEVRAKNKELQKKNLSLLSIEKKYTKAKKQVEKADKIQKTLKEVTSLARKISKREKLPTKEGGFFSKHLELPVLLEKLGEAEAEAAKPDGTD